MKIKLVWVGVGLAAGAAALGILKGARWLPLPWAAWQPVLVERHGAAEGRRLTQQAMHAWRELVDGYPHPLPGPPLRAHLVDNILPGLAMYRVLLEVHHGDRPAALAEIEPLFQAWTKALYGGMMWFFRHIPAPFSFFRLGIRQNMKGFPADTWRTVWVEDSSRRMALDQFNCPYVNTLAVYGAPELTPFFCRIDDWMAEMLPPAIGFRRSQTLAQGGDRCDFCYERLN